MPTHSTSPTQAPVLYRTPQTPDPGSSEERKFQPSPVSKLLSLDTQWWHQSFMKGKSFYWCSFRFTILNKSHPWWNLPQSKTAAAVPRTYRNKRQTDPPWGRICRLPLYCEEWWALWKELLKAPTNSSVPDGRKAQLPPPFPPQISEITKNTCLMVKKKELTSRFAVFPASWGYGSSNVNGILNKFCPN
jgi:hypothetical protein